MHAAPRFTLARLAFCCTLLTIVAPAAWAQDRPAASGSRQAPSGTSRQSSTRSDWRRASFLQDVPQGEGVMEAIPGPYVEGHPVVPEFLGPGPVPHGDCGRDDCWQDYCGQQCQDACCGCRCGWYAGAEAVWLRPYLNDNIAYSTHDSQDVNATFFPFDPDYEITPRFWIGGKNCDGLGLRLSYWEFDQLVDRQQATPQPPGFVRARVREGGGFYGDDVVLETSNPGELLNVDYSLEMRTWDLDVTQDLNWCSTNVRLFGGVRYLDMSHLYRALLDAPVNEELIHAHNFHGWGLSIGFEADRPIWGAWGIYCSLRESVFTGESDRVVVVGGVGGPTIESLVASDVDKELAVTELKIGVQYALSDCAYARAGWERQVWHSAGGPNDIENDLGLSGFGAALGVTF